jgi:hypothetical protein
MSGGDIDAVALFCEDIREEKKETHTVVGVFGDIIVVPGFPGAMPKFGVYIRINIPVDNDPCKFDIFFNYPNGERVLAVTVEQSLVASTIADAKKTNNPIAGIVSHLVASPFPITEDGRICIEIQWDEKKRIIGGVNFALGDNPIEITA